MNQQSAAALPLPAVAKNKPKSITGKKAASLEKVAAIIAARKKHSFDELLFMPRGLVQTTLPHSKTDKRRIQKKSGSFSLTMTAVDDAYALPYGIYPRLILLWLCTEVQRLKGQDKACNTIYLGRSFADFTRKIGVVADGKNPSVPQHEQIRYQLECLLHTVFLFSRCTDQAKDGNLRHIADSWSLWPEKGVKDKPAYIKLHNWFVVEILMSSVPFDIDAIKEFRRSSMDLDIFLWATWRLPQLPARIPTPVYSYESLADQFGANYKNINEFKYRLVEALEKLKVIWPALRYEKREKGLVFFKASQMVSKKFNPQTEYALGDSSYVENPDQDMEVM